MWIELHDTVRDHPKPVKLSRRLGIPKAQAIGHVICLWTWALRNAIDGDLSQYDPEDIEIAAEFEGEVGSLYDAMVDVKLINDSGNGKRTIHDWMEYQGSLKAAHRKAAQRDKDKDSSQNVPGQSQDSPRTVSGQSENVTPDHDHDHDHDLNKGPDPDHDDDDLSDDLSFDSVATVSELEFAVGGARRYKALTALQRKRLAEMEPFPSPDELSSAFAKTDGADNPCWGYFLSCLESERKPPTPRRSRSRPKRDTLKHGYQPVDPGGIPDGEHF